LERKEIKEASGSLHAIADYFFLPVKLKTAISTAHDRMIVHESEFFFRRIECMADRAIVAKKVHRKT
jgi:hypothetical protein